MTNPAHPVERLFTAMNVAPWPDGVVEVPRRIAGTAFFPGGSGLWETKSGEELPRMPIGGVMILGHDFHSEVAFARSYKDGGEYLRGPTWGSLLRVLAEVGVAPSRCFFTNAYMGLRKGSATTGRFPGSRDASFVDRCRDFFLVQLEAQQPSVILTLGAYVPAFLAPLSPDLAHWKEISSLTEIDRVGPVVHRVAFRGPQSSQQTTVVALTHPSMRRSNVGRRVYRDLRGADAELAMLRDGLTALP